MTVLISPMVVPVVIIGVASYLFFAPLGMGNSYLSLIPVHAVLGVPFVIITVSATLQGFNYNCSAAASLGASPLTAFFRVTLPLIAPGVISGALFAFATSFDEVVVTLFLAGPEQITLPRQMFSGIRENLSLDHRRRGDVADRLLHRSVADPGVAARPRREATHPTTCLTEYAHDSATGNPICCAKRPISTVNGARPTVARAPRSSTRPPAS